MNDIVKTVNEIEEIYKDAKPVKVRGAQEWKCPVCKKSYKREKSCENHIAEQDCYKAVDLFRHTDREVAALELYQSIMQTVNPSARVNISTFRKGKSYGPVIKFSLACSYYQIKDPELYYAWVRDSKNLKHINSVLKAGRDPKTIQKFRNWLISNHHYIESMRFWERFEYELNSDPLFFALSLERAHISIVWLIHCMDMSMHSIIADLPLEYRIRVEENYKLATGGGE